MFKAPDGWKFVPITPTKAMLKAGRDFGLSGGISNNGKQLEGRYSAMVEAAPTYGASEVGNDD